MKHFIYSFCISIVAAGFIACTTTAVKLEEAQRGIVLLPDSTITSSPTVTVLQNADQSTTLSVYDKERHSVLFFDTQGKELQRTKLQLSDSMLPKTQTLYAQALSRDSIIVLETATRTLLLFNGEGKLLRQFTAETKLADNCNDYCLLAMGQSPVKYDGVNLLCVCTRLDVVLRTKEMRVKYFSTPPEIKFNMQTGAQSNMGVWPAEYKEGGSFRDFFPQRCINNHGQIVYGFAASDSLFVMKDGKLVEKHFCKSEYMNERHAYPDDSLGHFFYLEKYNLTELRYLNLIYDPYRNYYYRIVHHAIPFEKENGLTLNTYSDKTWSLMILDEHFEVLNEIVFDPHLYIPAVFPAKEGLLIKRNPEKNPDKNISFTLFKFTA